MAGNVAFDGPNADEETIVATPTSLQIKEDLTFEEWQELVKKLQLHGRFELYRWLVGDWLVYGEKAFGRSIAIQTAAKLLDFRRERVNQYLWVSRNIEPARRRSIHWTYHRCIAGYPPDEQDKWLSRAEAEGWSVGELKAALAETYPEPEDDEESEREHTKMEYLLLELGRRMGYELWVAPDDRHRSYDGQRLGEIHGILPDLPQYFSDLDAHSVVRNIDVLFLRRGSVFAAFEVENTTSVYSGLLRMSDLITTAGHLNIQLYIVAPERRRPKVVKEINRPTFRHELRLPDKCRLIVFETLEHKFRQLDKMGVLDHLKDSFLSEISESCDQKPLIEDDVED